MYIRKIIVAVLLLGIVIGGVMVYNIYTAIFSSNTSFQNKEAFVFIPTNSTFNDVLKITEPLLSDASSFELVAKKKGYSSNVKAGRYIITKGMSNNDIVNTLRSKNSPIRVSFNNQETLEKLAGRIATQIEADSMSLITAFKDKAFMQETDFDSKTVLGMYIPNTYEFFWNTSAEQFRDRMLKEYKAFWNTSRMEKLAKVNLSKSQAITLASIVHEETVKIDERPRVAGVYLNRIRQGIPLQADPTVIYAIKEHTNDFDTVIKRVLYKDLEIDSPYNTYKYKGLPPGPITMPDVSAIDAVLNHEKHEFLYFVADVTNFGYHKFAKTLAQHNQNKASYIKWINAQNIKR